MKLLFVFASFLLASFSFSQTITTLTSGNKTSLRGLSVVNDAVVWASGSNGTVARSVDGGKTFQWLTVKGFEQRDFRDIEAFDDNTAIIMAVAEPAIILKTKDGGKTWKRMFEDTTKGMFLDAMDFYKKSGVVIGDPVDSVHPSVFIAFTRDAGEHWTIPDDNIPLSKGEAFFASSGTNVKMLPLQRNLFRYGLVSGGTQSHFIGKTKDPLPLLQGKQSTGANSMAINLSAKRIVVVGGDFANDKDTTGNCVFSTNLGTTWQHPQTPPHGYRSCVEFINGNKLISCGTSGVDVSNDGGNNWNLISSESFHVCQKAKNGAAVFLAGNDGRIAKLMQ